MDSIMDKINLSNPYMIAVMGLICLIVIMCVFVPAPKAGTIFKVSIYYGIILFFILDLFHRNMKKKYKIDSYESSIQETVTSTLGSGEMNLDDVMGSL